MRKGLWLGSLLVVCAVAPSPADEKAGVLAQDDAVTAEPIVIRGAEVIGKGMVPYPIEVDLRDLPVVPEWQPGDPIKDIPRRAYPPEIQPPAIVDPIPDRLLALQPIPPEPATRDFDVPILNFDAQNYTGVNPPDTVGDVGPNHYVQAINNSSSSSVVVYNKTTGAIIAGPFLMSSLGAPAPCNSGFGDPVVLYDGIADRWVLLEFAGSGNNICLYVSRTADPVAGGWWAYRLGPLTNFPDYPKIAVWPDAYYLTSNEGNAPPAYALDRTNMLNGAVARPTQRFTGPGLAAFGFECLTPGDLDGATGPPAGAPAVFARHRDDEAHNPPGNPAIDFVDLFEFHVDFNTPANSTFTQLPSITIADFSSEMCGLTSFACAPQPGTTVTIDPLREPVMWRLQYRNFGTHQALVGNFVTDADGEPDNPANLERLGVRWFELRKTAAVWTLFQEGTHSPDANPRFMGAISQDGDGNIALGYNISNNVPAIFPSLRYAGRLASDAPGTLRAETALADGAAFNASSRYGDYAAMSIDPVDDCTFWFTGMYNPLNSPANRWRTRIGSFKFDDCGNAIPANNAVFEPVLQAPTCLPTGRACDSAALLVGRDTIPGGNEPNQPNTIGDSCADGTGGTFHVRESVDRIRVGTLDGTQMSPGKVVRVDVTVYSATFPGSFDTDTLDIYSTATANSPVWTLVASIPAPTRGLQVLSANYTLPAGALQAVRAHFRYQGRQSPCGSGRVDDHDDLAFTVQ
jgi:hypothetical protein